MILCDVAVVGGGIAGASLAWKLALDADVVLIEAETVPGYHTTGRSAAFFLPYYGGEKLHPLTAASGAFLADPPADFHDGTLLSRRGSLHIAREDQKDVLLGYYEEIRKHSDRVKLLSPAQLEAAYPLVKPGYAKLGLEDPDCFEIDVATLHQGYLKGLKKRGGTVITDMRVNDVERNEGEGVWYLRSGDKVVRAIVVVNAAGAWADEVAKMAGLKGVGVMPLRRTIAIFETEGDAVAVDGPIIVDANEDFYMRPETGGLLVSPCDESPSPPTDARPEEEDVATAAHRVEAATGLTLRRVINKWAGLRTFTPDRVPAIGFDKRIEGFFWCVGQGGFGIQTAPAIAALGAALILDSPTPGGSEATPIEPANYDPNRFL
jgi:D-arginine dehydrogenase